MLAQAIEIGRRITPKFLTPLGSSVATRLCTLSAQLKGRRALSRILKYYSGPELTLTAEQEEVLANLREFGFNVFPYPKLFARSPAEIEVFYDADRALSYAMMDGKRLYYPEGSTKAAVQANFFMEQIVSQQIDSPHRYLTDDFTVQPEEVIVDCGAADGNFSLGVVEKAKRIYLFEPAPRWEKALNATFAPWKDKVVLVRKFISDVTDEVNTRLDDYFDQVTPLPSMIKMDIEGFEGQALEGARRILQAADGVKKVVTCTYHKQDDEQRLGTFLRQCGFQTAPSKGYMLFAFDDDVKPPYLRRGVLRAEKPRGPTSSQS